ncbi:hypothetical protein [Cloacibacterium normanense]
MSTYIKKTNGEGKPRCAKFSAARTWKVGDPEPPSGIAKPREPDDIDAGILIDETDYNSFLDEMETIIDDLNDAEKFKNSSDYQSPLRKVCNFAQ